MQEATVTDDGSKAEVARHTAHGRITAHDLRILSDMAMAIDRMPAFSIANRGQRPQGGKERLFCIFELASKHHFFRLAGQASVSIGFVFRSLTHQLAARMDRALPEISFTAEQRASARDSLDSDTRFPATKYRTERAA